jgi:hypothetical protein
MTTPPRFCHDPVAINYLLIARKASFLDENQFNVRYLTGLIYEFDPWKCAPVINIGVERGAESIHAAPGMMWNAGVAPQID